MMEAALTALLEDAETLRCSYPEIDGVPMQQVHPVAAVPVRWVEATDPASLATIERSIEEALDAPFDLRTAVPTEVVLIRVADDDHRLVILSHHISLDGWSEALLARHLRDRYRAVRSGVGAAGAEADSRPRFLDVAAWSATAQTATVGPDLARALEGADAVDPWTEHDPGKETELTVLGLDRITVEALSDLARQEGTTLFAALVAAASLVLGDAWDLDRPIVAVSVAGRTDVAAEDLLGRFAVLRPLAGDLRGDPTVRELVRRVGQDLVATIDSTRVPLQEVLRALPAGVRRRFHSVSLQQRTFPRPPIPEGAPWIAPIDAPMDGDLPVDLAADLLPDGSVRLVLRTTPPEPLEEVVPAVAALLPTAMRLLPDLADDRCSAAAARVRSAELPPSAEAETPLRRRPVTTVVDRIRTIASTEPSAPAVEAPTGTIDYAALVAAMDDVAARLHAIGLVPGEAVVVTGPRCAGTIVAMLGVLQAGGVMVPLPTNLPMGAMAERIDAAGARRVITVGSITVGAVPVGSAEVGARVDLRLDEHGRVLDGPAPAAAHPSGPTPDDPAYVFFTSGTSGRARSVVGVHHSLAQFVDWQRGAFGIGPDDRVAMLTSIGFDVVLRTIFLPLTAGACLVVPPDDLDAADVLPWTVEHSVSVLHLTPGLAATWMATGPTELPPGRLRWTFFAGEPLTGALVRRWRGHLPTPGNVVNLYGPTETTMARAAWCVPDVVEDDAILPVGWAIPGSRLLVVDGDGRPVGAGERGEIVVQTVHGTAGYGNDPEGWAARLLPTDHADEVRYRTGDAGVRRPDGTIVVLGRLDDEVKVEGTRVQPADVTARLRRLPGVAAAEVTVVEEDDGTLALLAAVVPADPSLTARDVRTGLGAELPAASVPRHVRLLDRLPLTVNGKVDRAAIRA
ncbi:MAG: AMP-binding protein, partial [Acidimicrobiales bacterium]|nr:AMP-binding protein [Acidimicrobiales bacterium]